MFQFKTLSEIKNAISGARYDALRQARRGYKHRGVFCSSGTHICTIDEFGQCQPSPEAGGNPWHGTIKEIKELVNECLEKYPNVCEIYIGCRYSHANSYRDYQDGDCDPDVADWQIAVWKKCDNSNQGSA